MKKIFLILLICITSTLLFASESLDDRSTDIEKKTSSNDIYASNRKIFFTGSLGATFLTDQQEDEILDNYTEKTSGLPLRFFLLFDNNFLTTYNLNIDYFDPFSNSLYVGASIGSKKISQEYDNYVSFWNRDYYHSLNIGLKVGYNFSIPAEEYNSILIVPYVNLMYEASGFNLSIATKIIDYTQFSMINSLGIEVFFAGSLKGIPFIFFEIGY
jgi:hypothetical protein